MTTEALLLQAYAAFNRREADAVLALMTDDVSWPKASEGGRVVGGQAIREYWERQWMTFDPDLEVLEISVVDDGTARVRVHQVVRDMDGNTLSDTELWHIYTMRDGSIARMDLHEPDGTTSGGGSSAFAGR